MPNDLTLRLNSNGTGERKTRCSTLSIGRCRALSKGRIEGLEPMTIHSTPPEVWLSKDQLRAATSELQVSIIAIAKVFGANERTARRWSSGDMQIPAGVSVLIRLLLSLKRKDSYEDMAEKLEHEARMLRALAEYRTTRTPKRTAQTIGA